jgi:TrmH RNA methyltransferase
MNTDIPVNPASPRRNRDEMRLYGINACRAAFAQRPHDLRKVYLLQTRIPDLQPVLAWCVQKRLGYRVVEHADLDKLTGSQHHEGVCFEMRRRAPLSLTVLLQRLAPRRNALLSWLDGVGNPHNFGAVLRSAANFGVDGVILSGDATLAESGAALRVAEGGADAVPLARIAPGEDAFGALRNAGFSIAATVPREGETLFAARLPGKLVFALGAEGAGLSRGLIDRADLHLSVPGTGAVESLNVAASAAVLFGEYWRQHRQPRPERQPRR